MQPWRWIDKIRVFLNSELAMPVGLIESLDHEARGITRLEGKAIFVEGALPGEIGRAHV